jgi:hypothetical protein
MSKDLSEWVHPHFPRWITLREAAGLQGFPDAFWFPCSESAALTQVGNGVPPPLAHAMGSVIAETLGVAMPIRKRGCPAKGERAGWNSERNRQWREGTKFVLCRFLGNAWTGLALYAANLGSPGCS